MQVKKSHAQIVFSLIKLSSSDASELAAKTICQAQSHRSSNPYPTPDLAGKIWKYFINRNYRTELINPLGL